MNIKVGDKVKCNVLGPREYWGRVGIVQGCWEKIDLVQVKYKDETLWTFGEKELEVQK